jgi:hypothetical protein
MENDLTFIIADLGNSKLFKANKEEDGYKTGSICGTHEYKHIK